MDNENNEVKNEQTMPLETISLGETNVGFTSAAAPAQESLDNPAELTSPSDGNVGFGDNNANPIPETTIDYGANTPETLVEEPVVEQPPKKKKKGGLVLLLIIVILAALGGAGYVYKDKILALFSGAKKANTPRQVFETTVDTASNKLLSSAPDSQSKTTFTLKYKPKTGSTIELKANVEVDPKDNYQKTDMTIKYDSSSLGVKMYQIGKKMYFYSPDLFDRYIDMTGSSDDSDPLSSVPQIDFSDITKLYESIIKDFKTVLKDEYFTQTKEGNLTKSTLTIDSNNIEQIRTDLNNALQNDAEFIKAYSKITGMTEDQVKEEFSNAKTQTGEEVSLDLVSELTIDVYTDANNAVVKVVFTSGKSVTTIDNIITGSFNITMESDGNTTTGTVTYTTGDESSFKIELNTSTGKVTIETSTKAANITKDTIPEEDVVKMEEMAEIDQMLLQMQLQSNPVIAGIMGSLLTELIPTDTTLNNG
jgi:hypothetical protein